MAIVYLEEWELSRQLLWIGSGTANDSVAPRIMSNILKYMKPG